MLDLKRQKAEIKDIIIGICTYKRPEKLERLLDSLCDLNYPEKIKVSILIIDNDFEQSAKEIYEKFKSKSDIFYYVEERRGFSSVRNRVLKEAIRLNATHIAFIDDDETADKNWLINHINFYNKFENIYISSGPTYKKFENDCPKYIKNNKTFKNFTHKVLGQEKKTCASGNVFFPLDIVKDNNIYFSEIFNYSGSEDIEFFGQLYDLGYSIGWNCDAVNFEMIGQERANVNWIIKRAFHDGHCVSFKRFLHCKNKLKIIFYIVEKFTTVIGNIIIIPFSVIKGFTGLLNSNIRLIKNIGKLTGAIMVLCNKKPLERGIV